jgi:hypothetical protein
MFFGSIEHEIAGEIAKIVSGEYSSVVDETIAPVDWDRLAQLRQQESLVTPTSKSGPKPVQVLLWQAGSVLVATGQKMMQAANQVLEGNTAAAQISSEDC